MLIGLSAGGLVAARAGQGGGATRTSSLKIVVIEGEGAVNVVQQKTAVALVVEVHDRNDQPVAGAVVTFSIRGGRAAFNGARTLTLTTNAAGRAAAAGLTPTGSGALHVTASAVFQGQTAVATITQTNIVAAQAAAAGAGGGGAGAGGAGGGGAGGGSAAGGAAGGAGGGLSTTTVAVIGGAVAGGAVAANEITGDDNDPFMHYSGPFSGSTVWGPANGTCSFTNAHEGTVKLDIVTASDGTVTSTGDVNETRTITQSTCGGAPVGAPSRTDAATRLRR